MEISKNTDAWKKLLRKHWITLPGLLLGVFLLVWSNFLPPKQTSSDTEYSVQYYTEILEQRITALCTSVSGIQEAAVLLTLESGSEYVYAQNTTTSGSTTGAWDYVIIRQGEGEEAVMVTEIYPKIRGVAVVCTGGDSAAVRQTITELLSAALGISSNRIRVAGS